MSLTLAMTAVPPPFQEEISGGNSSLQDMNGAIAMTLSPASEPLGGDAASTLPKANAALLTGVGYGGELK